MLQSPSVLQSPSYLMQDGGGVSMLTPMLELAHPSSLPYHYPFMPPSAGYSAMAAHQHPSSYWQPQPMQPPPPHLQPQPQYAQQQQPNAAQSQSPPQPPQPLVSRPGDASAATIVASAFDRGGGGSVQIAAK